MCVPCYDLLEALSLLNERYSKRHDSNGGEKKRGRLGSGYNLQPDPSLSRFFTSNFAQFTD